MRLNPNLWYLGISTFALIFHSCTHLSSLSTDGRIEKNRVLYDKKSEQERSAISNGLILPGMTRDAVYLAWGNPKSRLTGFENGKPFEEWTYQKLRPEIDIQVGVGDGPGLGVEKKFTKSVRFIDGRVTSFQEKQ